MALALERFASSIIEETAGVTSSTLPDTMQMVHHSSSSALVLLALISSSTLTDCLNLRSRGPFEPMDLSSGEPPSGAGAPTAAARAMGAVSYDVVKKTSIDRKATLECLCKQGQFWHWRIKDCVDQGAWGYECGYFPEEHHKMVCMDNEKCEALGGSDVKYSGFKGAKPASCQHCDKDDKCLAGEERHAETCLKEYLLSGSACQTVSVTAEATATATATEKVTKKSVASANATARASQKATATKEAMAEGSAVAEGKEGLAIATEEATASVTKHATAKGKATVEAQGSGEASVEAEATESGSAEGKACVTVEEVKEFLEIKNKQRFAAVLSAKVVSTGDELAFDKAYALALAAARKAGLINAQEAAKAAASAKAREHAGLEAKAKADEAAAWKAEAGANKEAQDKAKAEALAKARKAAAEQAADAARTAAEAAAKAQAAKNAAAAAKAAADAAAKADADKKAAAEAAAKAAAEAAAKAKAEAEAAAARAKAAKAAQEAMADYIDRETTPAPIVITTAKPTNAPVKITAEQIRDKLP